MVYVRCHGYKAYYTQIQLGTMNMVCGHMDGSIPCQGQPGPMQVSLTVGRMSLLGAQLCLT